MTTKEEAAAVDEAQYTLGPDDKVAVKKHVKRGGGAGWARVTVRDSKMKDSILQWGVAGQWPADLATKGHEAPYYSVHQISGKACYIKSHEKKEKGDSDKKDKDDPDADKPKLFVRYENKGKDDNDIPEIEFKKYFEDILDQMEKQEDWRNSDAVKNADQMPGIFNPYAMPNPYMSTLACIRAEWTCTVALAPRSWAWIPLLAFVCSVRLSWRRPVLLRHLALT
mmetsp:Transcript_59058/g.136210  ORF Transcript_59058/g.136210 Transcript_59058/m.136210 type:complete len:224 (-) Transcript_59058:62-733(-)